MSQRRFRMEHAIFRSVEDCHDIRLDGADPRVEEPTPGLSVRGGTLVAVGTTRGGTSAPQQDDLCTIATFVAGMQQMIPAPCSTFYLMHALGR